MNLTYRDLVLAKQPGMNMNAFDRVLTLKPAPTAAVAIPLAMNVRRCTQALKDFDTARAVVFEAYAEEMTEARLRAQFANEDGDVPDEQRKAYEEKLEQLHKKPWQEVPDEQQDAFEAEFDELLDQPVAIKLSVITTDMLTRCEEKREGFEIPMDLLYRLWFMFEMGLTGDE